MTRFSGQKVTPIERQGRVGDKGKTGHEAGGRQRVTWLVVPGRCADG